MFVDSHRSGMGATTQANQEGREKGLNVRKSKIVRVFLGTLFIGHILDRNIFTTRLLATNTIYTSLSNSTYRFSMFSLEYSSDKLQPRFLSFVSISNESNTLA
jgi:hypothetical protein